MLFVPVLLFRVILKGPSKLHSQELRFNSSLCSNSFLLCHLCRIQRSTEVKTRCKIKSLNTKVPTCENAHLRVLTKSCPLSLCRGINQLSSLLLSHLLPPLSFFSVRVPKPLEHIWNLSLIVKQPFIKMPKYLR